MSNFKACFNCGNINDDPKPGTLCRICGTKFTQDSITDPLSEYWTCPHGFAIDMACDDCKRSGFRIAGVNDGTEAERAVDGPDFACERSKGRVMAESEWFSIHRPHITDNKYEKVYNNKQPPSGYRLFKIVCPCGASLQSMEELGEKT